MYLSKIFINSTAADFLYSFQSVALFVGDKPTIRDSLGTNCFALGILVSSRSSYNRNRRHRKTN